jgi:hypothetical protein
LPTNPSTFAPTIVANGKVLHYRRTEPFRLPVLDETDSAVVSVQASVYGDGVDCRATPIARVTAQDSTSVTILVAAYGGPVSTQSDLACTDILLSDVHLKVELSRSLGARRVLDGADNLAARTVLDPATVPKPSYLPSGFRQQSVDWRSDRSGSVPILADSSGTMRSYLGPGSDSLELEETTDLSLLDKPNPNVVARFTVAGAPAVMTVFPGFPEDFLIQWQPDPQHLIRFSQASSEPVHHGLSASQFQALAQTVR